MYDDGVLDVGVVSCGQGVGLVHDIPTVQELFDRMMAEAETMGANAIVTVRFTTSYIMGSASEILAFGDAVVIEQNPEVEGF